MKPAAIVLIACYGGDRRYEPDDYRADHSVVLRKWADTLSRLDYEADICFASNGGDANYSACLDTLRKRFLVVDHENIGHSQGAWAAAWRTYPDYDYYIIAEDDYILVLNHFDKVLAGALKSAACDYLCQYLWNGTVAMMNGILSGECLRAMHGFPFEGAYGQAAADQGQESLAPTMRGMGLVVAEMGDMFRLRIPGEGRHQDYDYYPEKDTLFLPAQWYELAQ